MENRKDFAQITPEAENEIWERRKCCRGKNGKQKGKIYGKPQNSNKKGLTKNPAHGKISHTL